MTYETFLRKLGRRIKKMRLDREMTQEQMEDFGDYSIPTRTLQQIEYGRRNPRMSTLFNIAHQLKVDPKDLFDFSSPE
ncbi:MAG TPA: helix-turn-helix transcriptional regulator [Leptospiraceae bacterium]|nr:helix-turn-helix transcriptional regulator [Leptospiraceae bacterium]